MSKVIRMEALKRVQTSTVEDIVKYVKKISIKEREVQCPVRSKYFNTPMMIREYLIPVDLLTTDQLSQGRVHGKNNSIVASLARQLEADGLRHGVCCVIQEDQKTGSMESLIRWGSHRWNAVKNLASRGAKIRGEPVGYIWASLYNEYHSSHELNILQTIENNLIQAKEPAKDEDNIVSLEKAWKDGSLDIGGVSFSKLSEQERRKSLKVFIKEYMGANVKSPKSLIDKFFAKNKAKVRTDTKTALDHEQHWNLFEGPNFGVHFTKSGASHNRETDAKGDDHYLVHQTNTWTTGANLQHMIDGKIGLSADSKNLVDVTHLVVSFPLTTISKGSDALKKAREKRIQDVKHINSLFTKNVVDYLYFMPQSQPEEDAAATGQSPWVKKIVF